ncbi:TetR/AcrR family transcriptional regulator [Siccirubricoccus phaeus]|uniref:TetR/AcrR family transcriptional regulator n=1 Tax=Siccirubricoccus phaeus TaxID=2595053 RepID=UPI0011F225BC|nr:TetR/AcrR family transcriptional regulator [Siccirubricoccus phaeus]
MSEHDDQPGCEAAPEARSAKAQAIMEAAAELFLAQGYAATSMEAVARRAGVSKATLYAHFPGKDTLFRAVVGERCNRMAIEAVGGRSHDEPLRPTLERLGTILLRFLIAPATLAIYRTVKVEALREPALAEIFYAAGPAMARTRLAAWIAEAQRRGRIRADADPSRAAVDFGSLLRGDLWLRATLGLPPAPDEAAIAAEARAAADVFLRAYGMPEAEPQG